MRIGVLRGDLPGPVYVGDLETVSQTNFPVDPVGQTRYLARPTPAAVTTALATVPASLQSSGNITFAATINSGNKVLKLRAAASGAYTTVTLAEAAYASVTTLLAAINAALVTAGLGIVAEQGTTNVRIRFKTTTSLGVGASIGLDTVANGSTANTILGLPDGGTHSVPTGAATIIALNPVGGTLDVSSATQLAQVSPAMSVAQIKAVADVIAPQFFETRVAVHSYQVGQLSKLRNAGFNPDPNRLPALTPAAAVAVVQDDGVTAFSSSSLAPVPNISAAVFSGGTLTITGTGLGNSEYLFTTVVKTTNSAAGTAGMVTQRKFVAAGGTVSATSVVLPGAQLTNAGYTLAVGHKVQVQVGSLASNVFTITAS